MTRRQRYAFTEVDPNHGKASLMPLLPINLSNGERSFHALALLDTGSAVNVMPYSVGQNLGFVWDHQTTSVVLTGNLARIPARGVVLTANVGDFSPIRLVFAWSKSDDVRLVLGHANFFMEFDVCFFRALSEFEIEPRAAVQK
jgi:hypothetical protein